MWSDQTQTRNSAGKRWLQILNIFVWILTISGLIVAFALLAIFVCLINNWLVF